MTVAEEKQFFNLVRWRNKQWRSDPDWEDILSESLLLAWCRYRRGEGIEHHRLTALSVSASRFGWVNWRRRWCGRTADGKVREPLATVSLDDPSEVPSAPFEAQALSQMEAERIWEAARQVCPPRQLQALEAIAGRGLTYSECAAEMGIARGAAGQCYQLALKKCREALGL